MSKSRSRPKVNIKLPSLNDTALTFAAAQIFVESFYSALNNPHSRSSLTNFYLKPTPTCKVDLTLNGAVIADPTALQEIFEKQIEKCHYDVQAYDCQVVNRNYTVGAPEGTLGQDKDGRKMSIVVMVNGSVKYFGEDNDGEVKGFTDSFLLVPNWETQGPKGNKKGRRWLIQTQTFRVVA